jgi:hypothetical protein
VPTPPGSPATLSGAKGKRTTRKERCGLSGAQQRCKKKQRERERRESERLRESMISNEGMNMLDVTCTQINIGKKGQLEEYSVLLLLCLRVRYGSNGLK